MMADSGARGSREQIRQLGGMRGLMAKPQKSLAGSAGEIIENPIKSNFKEGLSVARVLHLDARCPKGLADTALKTADAGYLTRRLVDVAQDVTITMHDCGTLRGIRMEALKDNEDIVEPLADRILGRVSVHDVRDPLTDEVLVARERADHRGGRGARSRRRRIETVEIRSVLACEAPRGVCALCYGRNLANRPPGRDRRGRRRHRGAVHRRAGHAAHAADLPHRWYGQPHLGRVARSRPSSRAPSRSRTSGPSRTATARTRR